MVEVDRVPEVDRLQLLQGGRGVAERLVEVDRLDPGSRASGMMPENGRSVAARVAATGSTPWVTERR